jgi:hypothetical protein
VRVFPALAICVLIVAAAACNPRPPDESDYVTRITTARSEKETFFKTSSESPIPESRKGELLPLAYYPIDPSYHVPAALKPSDDDTTIMMPTSAGTADPMRRVGTLEFTIMGQTMTLAAFAPAAARTVDRLFVPFRDLTSGTDTYAAGRYLDLDRTATGIYQLDFNRAYNPNCYFDLLWICPLPPRENHLQIAVLAGERTKEKGKS